MVNCNLKNIHSNEANFESQITQNTQNDNLCQPLNLAGSLNSESGSNSTTILSSTNTNLTNLTYKNQRRSLVLHQIKINDDNYEEENEYTSWLRNANNNDADYSSSSINSITHNYYGLQ